MAEKQYAVLGLGRFGFSVASTLYALGQDVLGVDIDEEVVQLHSHDLTHVVAADTTDEESLKAIGIRNFDVVIVAIGSNDMQDNLMTTLILKELDVNHIVVKAVDLRHGRMLEKIGADKVVYPERDMGQRVAHNLVASNILDFIELSPNFGIVELSVPEKFINKKLVESGIREHYGLNVVAIRNGKDIFVPPSPDRIFIEDDILVVVGKSEGIRMLEKET